MLSSQLCIYIYIYYERLDDILYIMFTVTYTRIKYDCKINGVI